MYQFNKSSIEAASEAAAKVNAMLIAKGKLKPSQLNPITVSKPSLKQPAQQSNLIVAEVVINDVPPQCRNLLCRGNTQEEISKYSQAAVSTRGRYLSEEDKLKNPDERPLYLCIQGPDQLTVDIAVKRVYDIIDSSIQKTMSLAAFERDNIYKENRFLRQLEPFGVASRNRLSIDTRPGNATLFLQEKIYIGMEGAPASFELVNKILGPGGQYLSHIATETGAQVMLRGKGSGHLETSAGLETPEPMHLYLQHEKISGLQAAKDLSQNLIKTIREEYEQVMGLLAVPPTLGSPLTLQNTPVQVPMISKSRPTPRPAILGWAKHLQRFSPLLQVSLSLCSVAGGKCL